jgi:hypothetical protein
LSAVVPSGSGTDPAHDVGRDGRTLLQHRLALYFPLLLAFYVSYWPFVYLIWSRDPRLGHARALGHIFGPASLLLGATYITFTGLCRVRVWSVRQLAVLDVLGMACVSLCYAGLIRSQPSVVNAPLEGGLAIMSVLSIRALLVPSSWQRSALAGLVLAGPSLAMFLRERHHFEGQSVSFLTLVLGFVNWSLIAVTYSAFASAVLYGLRREVREARKLGQYTLLEKLGAGGMGVVYRAQHALLRRPTAIKLLNAEHAEHGLARFEREVQLMAELTHPNSVTIHDYGRTADGVLYYAMEYLEGLDMEALVKLNGCQPPGRVIHLLRQACGALSQAHARGLIHRDVKPANLFVCRDHGIADMVKVLDFGVVKQLHADGAAGSLSREQAIVGTPLYLSPESINAPQKVDARSDLYSLGAVAYLLLTGRALFDGNNVLEICAHHLFTEPAPPSQLLCGIPGDLEAIVLKCLSKEREARFVSADELAASLDGCADAHTWSSESARQWWAQQAQTLSARRQQQRADAPAALEQTIAIDGRRTLPGRAPAARAQAWK